jgi:hypothetical protein
MRSRVGVVGSERSKLSASGSLRQLSVVSVVSAPLLSTPVRVRIIGNREARSLPAGPRIVAGVLPCAPMFRSSAYGV